MGLRAREEGRGGTELEAPEEGVSNALGQNDVSLRSDADHSLDVITAYGCKEPHGSAQKALHKLRTRREGDEGMGKSHSVIRGLKRYDDSIIK